MEGVDFELLLRLYSPPVLDCGLRDFGFYGALPRVSIVVPLLGILTIKLGNQKKELQLTTRETRGSSELLFRVEGLCG